MAPITLPPPPRRALIVDDSPAARAALASAVGHYGFAAEEVDSGGDALRRLLYEEFALALVDLQMPVVDGVQLLRLLRTRGSRVPVILVSATQDMHLVRHTVKLGASDYLPKPFDVASVGESLGRLYGVSPASLLVRPPG
ncbi:MAG: response regulator [Anaeromyxobacteraceae bacterium]